jgi:hypothetical protein
VPSFAQATGAELAVNGDFFTAEPRVYGMAVGGGAAWPIGKTGIDPSVAGEWYHERYGWIAFGPDFAEFTHTAYVKKHRAQLGANEGFSPAAISHKFPPGTVALVSGFPELVTEGARVACASPTADSCFPDRSDMRARHPRTAMGLSKDRRTFILAVVDGRSSTSAGMYGTELAELMTELGAWQAFNLDGGGSSEMWIKGRGTVSDPSDGTSRAVGNHWGILTGGAKAAHCTPRPAAPDGGAPGDGGAGPEGAGDGGPEGPGAGPSSAVGPGGSPGERAADESAADAGEEGGCSVGARSEGAPFAAAVALLVGLALRRGRLRARR